MLALQRYSVSQIHNVGHSFILAQSERRLVTGIGGSKCLSGIPEKQHVQAPCQAAFDILQCNREQE
jgi:hypothetical protein